MRFKSSLLKTTVAVASLAVCSSISYASASAPQHFTLSTDVQVSNLKPVLVSATKDNDLTFSFTQTQFERVIDKPLLQIPEFKANEYIPTKMPRRNDIFEFATIFNDRLQQFLALFNGSLISEVQAAPVAEKHNNAPMNKSSTKKTCTSSSQIS